jgi:hypothetical protein
MSSLNPFNLEGVLAKLSFADWLHCITDRENATWIELAESYYAEQELWHLPTPRDGLVLFSSLPSEACCQFFTGLFGDPSEAFAALSSPEKALVLEQFRTHTYEDPVTPSLVELTELAEACEVVSRACLIPYVPANGEDKLKDAIMSFLGIFPIYPVRERPLNAEFKDCILRLIHDFLTSNSPACVNAAIFGIEDKWFTFYPKEVTEIFIDGRRHALLVDPSIVTTRSFQTCLWLMKL